VIGLSKINGFTTGVISTPEIAQCPLGDLNFLIAYLSFYVLLDDCQGIVRHREDDFDFHPLLPHIFLYVTSILVCLRIVEPEASLLIHAQVVQELEEHIEI
jgi:hypothetical protein